MKKPETGLLRQLIPLVTTRPTDLLDQFLVALVVLETSISGHSEESQRTTSGHFNRSNSAKISARKNRLAKEGWLSLEKKSRGLIPHRYSVGKRLTSDPPLHNEWLGLAEALFGSNGLIRDWIGSPAWGYGCLSESGVLVLAGVKSAQKPIRPSHLATALGCMTTTQTISRWCKSFCEIGVMERLDDARYQLASKWEEQLQSYFTSNPACCDRQQRIHNTTRQQRQLIQHYVLRGALTSYEKSRYRQLPCVRCGGKSHHVEHFPPRRYLEGVASPNCPLVLWSICSRHNLSMGAFIRDLPAYSAQSRTSVFPSIQSAVRCYAARSNRELQAFYLAVDRQDKRDALTAIGRTLDLLIAISKKIDLNSIEIPSTRGTSRRQGKKYRALRSTHASQNLY